jgi:hypothetical protein
VVLSCSRDLADSWSLLLTCEASVIINACIFAYNSDEALTVRFMTMVVTRDHATSRGAR